MDQMKRESTLSSLDTMIRIAIFMVPIILMGCSSYGVTFYPHEEWRLDARIELSVDNDNATVRAAIERELDAKAVDLENRNIQFEWHKDESASYRYLVTAEGQGWQLLNESLFGGQAVIQAGQNPGEISISCDCMNALLRLPADPVLHDDERMITLSLAGSKIIANNSSPRRGSEKEEAYWQWQIDRGKLDPTTKSSGRVEVLLAELPKPSFQIDLTGSNCLALLTCVLSFLLAAALIITVKKAGLKIGLGLLWVALSPFVCYFAWSRVPLDQLKALCGPSPASQGPWVSFPCTSMLPFIAAIAALIGSFTACALVFALALILDKARSL